MLIPAVQYMLFKFNLGIEIMKNKILLDKMLPRIITAVVLLAVMTVSLDALMDFFLFMCLVANGYLMYEIYIDHKRMLKVRRIVKVNSHQELRYYKGSANVAWNETTKRHYTKVPTDPNNKTIYVDDEINVIKGHYVWIRQCSSKCKTAKIDTSELKSNNDIVTNIPQV